MPERARAPTSRRTRRFAAEGLTIQKVFAAVLLGATLGLLASVIRVASRSRAKSVSDQHDKLQAVTAWQTSQQVISQKGPVDLYHWPCSCQSEADASDAAALLVCHRNHLC